MGNTPSNPNGGSKEAPSSQGEASNSPSKRPSSHQQPQQQRPSPNLRLPLPSTSHSHSPNSSNPTSPSGRPSSPRRRKSLELPDLNRLSFTPATPAQPIGTPQNANGHGSAAKNANIGPAVGSGFRKWNQALGGHRASPLASPNALKAMSQVEAKPMQPQAGLGVPIPGKKDGENPYLPSVVAASAPIPMPGRVRPSSSPPQPGQPSSQPPAQVKRPDAEGDGNELVPVLFTWKGNGREANVEISGTWLRDSWKARAKLRRNERDPREYSATLALPPGNHRLKFIVDDSWRCSNDLPTATDGDGSLVNWIEVEPARKVQDDEQLGLGWTTTNGGDAGVIEDEEDGNWTMTIPPPLALYQHLEEQASLSPSAHLTLKLPHVPAPPQLPRHLEKVILNASAREIEALTNGNTVNAVVGTGVDDNSLLPVPNHVVLNHLTASAIRNDCLAVGTTTRYKKKYITTVYFKPITTDRSVEA